MTVGLRGRARAETAKTKHGAHGTGCGRACPGGGVPALRYVASVEQLDPIAAALAAARTDDPQCSVLLVGSRARVRGALERVAAARGAVADVEVLTPLMLARRCAPHAAALIGRLEQRGVVGHCLRARGVVATDAIIDAAVGVWSELDRAAAPADVAHASSSWAGLPLGELVADVRAAVDPIRSTPGGLVAAALDGGALAPADAVVAVDPAWWRADERQLLMRLEAAGTRVHEVGHTTGLVGGPHASQSPTAGAIEHATVVASPLDEAVVAVGVVEAWFAAGIALDDIAVVVPSMPRHQRAMAAALQRAGLSASRRGVPFGAQPAAQAIRLRLALLVNGFELADVVALAALEPVGAAELMALARTCAVLRGAEAWQRAAQRLLESAGAEAGNPGSAAAARRRFATWIERVVAEARSAEREATTWPQWADTLRTWAWSTIAANPDDPYDEAALALAEPRLAAVLGELGDLDWWLAGASSGPVRVGAVAAQFAVGLGEGAGGASTVGGVVVASATALPLRPWKGLIVTGLADGSVPAAVRVDPLLDDATRAAVGLDPLGTAAQHEAFAVRDAIGSAERVALSRARFDDGGRAREASALWAEFVDGEGGVDGPVVADELASAFGALGRRAELGGLDTTDDVLRDPTYQRAVGLAPRTGWRADPTETAQVLVERASAARLGPRLQRRVAISARRSSSVWTEFDGIVGDVWRPPTRVSASALEMFAVCPRRYFFRHSLGVAALGDPDDSPDVVGSERGLVVHEVLAKVVRHAARAAYPDRSAADLVGGAVVDGRALVACGSRVVSEPGVIEGWISEQVATITAGRAVLAGAAEESVVARAVRTAWAEVERDAESGWAPVAAEWDLDVSLASATTHALFLRGRVDRVDRHADGRYRIVDYKTSSPRSPAQLADACSRGMSLQSTLYRAGLAEWLVSGPYANARGGAGAAPPTAAADGAAVGFELWFVGAKLERRPLGVCEPAVLDALIAAWAAGSFPMNPGTPSTRTGHEFENCGYCDFQTLCPPRRERRWEQTRSDPAVSAYLDFLQLGAAAAGGAAADASGAAAGDSERVRQ